ncbi:tRNA (5-methylaminomethyl-2-thiouridylate) methyltransferase [Buchnera aphidicola (Cinara tujafilina)]|uniref:tRNA-specific 2-thiouridylase MnmA n=1 Tax=Buchnera aphidicola (Cinara tujafilina) TaxID=261317 RepID=F7WZ99_9GAMM|nr:tRNA 2-thiouridine(34) synthase MnmA [Buchnera aphidicola]AEH39756.1 tRNA (5-methylaminomethyl-2-thiouridylate) methyltransferase [Buchnera aphidicola (Cinara tujafilina)]
MCNIKKKKRVILAMSGGVDSSVSAWILLKKKYHVEGLFMKNWEEDDNQKYCPSRRDLKDAQSVCKNLGIYLHIINFSTEYWNKVFIKFLQEYKKGNTPNPDILCNQEIKFKIFFNFAIEILHADYIATGHYAMLKKIKCQYHLFRAKDLNKDQSYFLYTLQQNIMPKILFPLAKKKKIEIRRIAKKINLCVFNKKDSTGICFIPPQKIFYFFKSLYPDDHWKIFTMSLENIGFHIGISYYTIGQRKGLKIGGKKNKGNFPWYVVKKDINKNIIFVVQGSGNPYLLSFGFFIKDVYWITKIKCVKFFHCMVQIRYRQISVPCIITFLNNQSIIKILFYKPVLSVSIGQSAVFYKQRECIGGGVIQKIIPYLP